MEMVVLLCLAAAVGAGYLIYRSTEDSAKLLDEEKEQAPVLEADPAPVKKTRATKKTNTAVKFATAAKTPAAKSTSRKKKQ